MQIKLLGGGSFYGPHGVMVSYGPNSVIDVDDGDKTSVTYWQERVDSGAAELVTPAAKAKAAAPPPAASPAKAAEKATKTAKS